MHPIEQTPDQQATAVQATIPGLKPPKANKVHADNAAKQAAYRARNDLKAVTLMLPRATDEALNAWLKAHPGKGKAETVTKLIETQLLRKR